MTREDGGTTPDRRSSAQQGHKGWDSKDITSQLCSSGDFRSGVWRDLDILFPVLKYAHLLISPFES